MEVWSKLNKAYRYAYPGHKSTCVYVILGPVELYRVQIFFGHKLHQNIKLLNDVPCYIKFSKKKHIEKSRENTSRVGPYR